MGSQCADSGHTRQGERDECMITRPREINKIMTKLTNSGYDVYCAGQCVMASYLGDKPLDWDLYTDCPQAKIRELFPEGEPIGSRVTRLDYSEEIISDDINIADSVEGIIADIVTLEGSIQDQLAVYDLTAEAVAEHPQKPVVDLYSGRDDIKSLILKPTANAEALIIKDPIRILKAVKYVALYNFDLHKDLYELLLSSADRLPEADKDDILYEFTETINGRYAGKALKMIVGLNMLPAIVGKEAAVVSRRGAQDYETLADNIDKIKQIPLRRLALFYLCFGRNCRTAVEYLPHEEQDREYLTDAETQINKLHFLSTEESLKNYIYHNGWDKYNFMDKLSKAQAIVYDLNTSRIEGRNYILDTVMREKQPIFIEDLAIDADDIIEAGITDDQQRAEYLLSLLPDVIHQKPGNNERKALLSYAKKFNKSKFRVAFRDVKWLR